MDTPDQPRAAYRSSGKVNWLLFLPGLAVAAGAALVMAVALELAYQVGLYLLIFAPILATLPVAGIWYLVLTWSRCRNRAVALLASIPLALLLYLGYYYVDMVRLVGLANAGRLDAFPNFVKFRMETDVSRDVHDVGNKKNRPAPAGPDAVQQAFNWLFFGTELLATVGIFTGVGAAASRRPFCEGCRRWMKGESIVLNPGVGKLLWETLQQGDFARLESLGLTRPAAGNAAGCRVSVNYCPDCAAEDGSPVVYLTVADVVNPTLLAKVAAATQPFAQPGPRVARRTLVNRVDLRPKEVGALAVAFPGLRRTVDAEPQRFADVQAAVQDIQRERRSAATEWTRAVATVEPVEDGYAGTVLTRQNALIQTAIGAGVPLGAMAVALGVPGIIIGLADEPPAWVSILLLFWMFGIMGFNLVWTLCYPKYLTARFMARQTRRAFESRPGLAVDPGSPDLIFVDIIPRTNWGKAMMENASDIGFLYLDKERRELIFEGDQERYWIPVDSILDVQHEFWSESMQHQFQAEPTKYHVVTVRAMTADGPWETWFYRRQDKFQRYTAKQRLGEAMALQDKIRELMESAG